MKIFDAIINSIDEYLIFMKNKKRIIKQVHLTQLLCDSCFLKVL